MSDPTDIVKIAETAAKLGDSSLPNKVYDDLLAPAMQESGNVLADFVKTLRLFTAPLQLFAIAQDRLAAFCERARSKVPEERQQQAIPSIALPVLMDLRYMEDENPLTELFVNLLARAIDKERCNEAHPAFIKIIEQLAADEAMILWTLSFESAAIEFTNWRIDPQTNLGYPLQNSFPTERLGSSEHIWMYFQHLESLGLVSHSNRKYSATPFGTLFARACIPEHFKILAVEQ